jgi:hypothetical protein
MGSRQLGIDLASGQPAELFKWFLACLLFGKPIQQEVAARAYGELARARLLTPRAILEAGWDRLVEVLDRGHYVRFDFSTATKLLDVCAALLAQYRGLEHLLQRSTSRAEVARRLRAFKGVGPTTTRIFLRDVTALWPGLERLAGRASRARPPAPGRGRRLAPVPHGRPRLRAWPGASHRGRRPATGQTPGRASGSPGAAGGPGGARLTGTVLGAHGVPAAISRRGSP